MDRFGASTGYSRGINVVAPGHTLYPPSRLVKLIKPARRSMSSITAGTLAYGGCIIISATVASSTTSTCRTSTVATVHHDRLGIPHGESRSAWPRTTTRRGSPGTPSVPPLREGLLRREGVEHGGRSCVRCTGTYRWTSLMDDVLGDPVHVRTTSCSLC
jgi:hypothetical protein